MILPAKVKVKANPRFTPVCYICTSVLLLCTVSVPAVYMSGTWSLPFHEVMNSTAGSRQINILPVCHTLLVGFK